MNTYTKQQIDALRTYLWSLTIDKTNLSAAATRTAQRARAKAKAGARSLHTMRIAACVRFGDLALTDTGLWIVRHADNTQITYVILYLTGQVSTPAPLPVATAERARSWSDLRKGAR